MKLDWRHAVAAGLLVVAAVVVVWRTATTDPAKPTVAASPGNQAMRDTPPEHEGPANASLPAGMAR
ncbi:MAG: hypothetical protein QM758_28750 [Armatimonas sp.]